MFGTDDLRNKRFNVILMAHLFRTCSQHACSHLPPSFHILFSLLVLCTPQRRVCVCVWRYNFIHSYALRLGRLTTRELPQDSLNTRLRGLEIRFGRFRKEGNHLSLSVIQLQFVGRTTRCLVAVSRTVSRRIFKIPQ